MQISPQILWYRYKKTAQNMSKSVSGRVSALGPAKGAHDAPSDHLVGRGGDTPIFHPTRHWPGFGATLSIRPCQLPIKYPCQSLCKPSETPKYPGEAHPENLFYWATHLYLFSTGPPFFDLKNMELLSGSGKSLVYYTQRPCWPNPQSSGKTFPVYRLFII